MLLATCSPTTTSVPSTTPANFYTSQTSQNSAFVIGIIDITQKWNWAKIAAMNVKSVRYKQEELSTVPPEIYAKRFEEFVNGILQ